MLFAALEKPRVKDPLAFQTREVGNGYNSLYIGKNVEGSSVTTRLMRKYKCGLQRFRSGWSFVETASDIGCLHLNLQFATKFSYSNFIKLSDSNNYRRFKFNCQKKKERKQYYF